MSEWTKEPWHQPASNMWRVDSELTKVARMIDEDVGGCADAARIVQCVNACQGIPDPAAALRAARAALGKCARTFEAIGGPADFAVQDIRAALAMLEPKERQ